MNRTEEGLFVGAALVVLTPAVLYGAQSLLVRPAAAEASPGTVVAAAPAPVREAPNAPPHPAPTPPDAAPSPPPAPVQATPAPVPAEPPVVPARPVSPQAPAVAAPPTPAPAPTLDPLARGRELTGLLYSERLEEVWAAFLPAVRADWRDFADFRAYRRSGLEAYGAETRVLGERVTRGGGLTYYTRTATFERGPREGWTLIFGLDSRGRVQEFGIVEAGLVPQGAGGPSP
ncbi:hypothetical protein [Deinococcus planocerae]|uniref:hypothetical protein n=1 Tax=Deinococcus planocerae TaxID=1737569 RepID=UPI000C7EBD48|nr:hypothetical protein [Deinococcus planocerae]